jgi:hypothetical protein
MVTKTFAQQDINTAANSGVGSEYSFTDRNGNEVKIKTDPSLLTAIGEFAANTGEVTQLEDLRGIAVKPNGTYNAQMTSALQRSLDDSIRRNDGTVKSKGGFHLATDFNLALDKIMDANPGMSLDQAQNTLKLNMDIGRLGSLAGSSSMDIGSMKMGEFVRMKDALNNEAAKNALSQTELDLIKGTLADVFKSPGARSNATDRMHLVVQAAESLGVAVPSDLAASASHGGGATPSGEAGTS